jgi:hypothetical protein
VAWQSAPLDGLDLVALLVDGVHLGDHCLIVALGIAADGQKHTLGLWDGSTETPPSTRPVRESPECAAERGREGLDETLTVLTLNLSARLRRSLATTHAAESVAQSDASGEAVII